MQSDRPNIFSLYEANIGPLTPMIADLLQEAEQTYPVYWIEQAMKIAVENNVRRWRYVEAILASWKERGRDEKDRRDAQEADAARDEDEDAGREQEQHRSIPQPRVGVARDADRERTEPVFARYIDPKRDADDRRWHDVAVDLAAYGGRTVRIVFQTTSGPAADSRFDWAVWGEPRLWAP